MYCCARGRARQLRSRHACTRKPRLDAVLHGRRQQRHVRHQLAVQQAQQRVRKARPVRVTAGAQPLFQRHHRQPRRLEAQQVAHRAPVLILGRRRASLARSGVVTRNDGRHASLHNLRRQCVSAGAPGTRSSGSGAPRRSG
jgi:hypothetical protein